MTFPPPTSIADVAFYVTSTHRDGGTWSALGRTASEAQTSMARHCAAFPGTYTHTTVPERCGVAVTRWGLVWRFGPSRPGRFCFRHPIGYTERSADDVSLDGRCVGEMAAYEDALFMSCSRPTMLRRMPDSLDPVRDDPLMRMACAGEPRDGVHGEGGCSG
jgi:hypothetical protein